jgi:hypothetical protein
MAIRSRHCDGSLGIELVGGHPAAQTIIEHAVVNMQGSRIVGTTCVAIIMDKMYYFVQYLAGRRPERLDFIWGRKGQNWTK